MRHRLGLATRTQISVCKSPFPSADTAVSLFRAKTVQQRPLLPREVETWLPESLNIMDITCLYSLTHYNVKLLNILSITFAVIVHIVVAVTVE